MNTNLTYLTFILDKSGSMDSMLSDTIGGYNSFLREQRELPGKVKFSLVLFDSEVNIVHDSVTIDDVPNLTNENYRPGGRTALLDALGMTIDKLGNTLRSMPVHKRPGTVIIAVLTDGYENDSKEYDLPKIRKMIEHQQSKYNWHFVFLAANQDAILEAGKMGMNTRYAKTYDASADGMRNAYATLSYAVSELTNDSTTQDILG